MSKYKKGKCLITICLILMCATLTAFSFLYFTNNKSYQKEPQAAVDIVGSGTQDDPYKIYTGAQLAYWSRLASVSGCADVVKIMNDIDMEGIKYVPAGIRISDDGMDFYGSNHFVGEFNGGGYTIRNITIDYYPVTMSYQLGTYGVAWLGLISNLGGSVHSVRIQNMTINVAPTYYASSDLKRFVGTDVYCGGIAGGAFDEATIYNCIVEGLTINESTSIVNRGSEYEKHSETGRKSCFYSGLVGCTQGRTSDTTFDYDCCYVEDFEVIGAHEQAAKRLITDDTGANGRISLTVGKPKENHKYSLNARSEQLYLTYSSKQNARNGLSEESDFYVPPTDEYNEGWPILCRNAGGGYFNFFKSAGYYIDVENDVEACFHISVPVEYFNDPSKSEEFVYVYDPSSTIPFKENGEFYGTECMPGAKPGDYSFKFKKEGSTNTILNYTLVPKKFTVTFTTDQALDVHKNEGQGYELVTYAVSEYTIQISLNTEIKFNNYGTYADIKFKVGEVDYRIYFSIDSKYCFEKCVIKKQNVTNIHHGSATHKIKSVTQIEFYTEIKKYGIEVE